MSRLHWSEKYATGIAAVDHEHRELIELINDTIAGIESGAACDHVAEFLGEILARISAHFALEERIMQSHRYREYFDHKADHDRLLDQLRDIMDEYEDGEGLDTGDLARRMDDWFSVHFQTKDARFHRAVPVE